MALFLIAYKRTAKAEGGWNHVAGDRGGETYCGIARRWHSTWAGWAIIDAWKKQNGTPEHGQMINDPRLEPLKLDFYKTTFWDKVWGDKILSQDFANQLYDMAVNASVPAAIELAETSTEQPPTGRMTISLLNKINKRYAA